MFGLFYLISIHSRVVIIFYQFLCFLIFRSFNLYNLIILKYLRRYKIKRNVGNDRTTPCPDRCRASTWARYRALRAHARVLCAHITVSHMHTSLYNIHVSVHVSHAYLVVYSFCTSTWFKKLKYLWNFIENSSLTFSPYIFVFINHRQYYV